MRLSLHIAKRYLFAKKSRNAINVISGVSVAGVAVGTMALVIILSVFNGLETMVTAIFSTFDPDVRITALKGKVFIPDSTLLAGISAVPAVEGYTLTLEENALLKYGERQFIGSVKGVDDAYPGLTGLKDAMWDGNFSLWDEKTAEPHAVIGLGVANSLGIRLNFITPLAIYMPDRKGSPGRPESAFKRYYIWPSGIFEIEKDFDSRYIFVPLPVMRSLLDYPREVSSVEVRLTEGSDLQQAAREIRQLMGEDFQVQDRFEQQEIFYKVMKSEKLAIFIILTFIIIVASFNIAGSLTMLIIEKEKDIRILMSLGAGDRLISRIFILEGWMISIFGIVIGLGLGFIICLLQQELGLVSFHSESLLIDAYPVVMKLSDFLLSGITVLAIGYLAAWYPVRYLNRKYLKSHGQ